MSILGDKVEYDLLTAKQKEIFNFQKVSSIFADYGYTTIKLADDWLGADFLALAFHGEKTIKVQLKGRMTFSKKYLDKQIFICFHDNESRSWYLYNHDSLLKEWESEIEHTVSWEKEGNYTFPYLSQKAKERLKGFVL